MPFYFTSHALAQSQGQVGQVGQVGQLGMISSEVAHTQKNSASLLLRWIDVRGNLYPGGRIAKMNWVWSRATDSDPIDSPALRVWVESRLPRDWVPQKITGDGVTIVEPFKSGEIQTLALDLRTTKSTIRFEFVDQVGRTSEMTLVIQVSVLRPYILVRPECNTKDLKFVVHKAYSKHLFVGLSCVDYADSMDIYFFRSRDSGWSNAPGLVQFDPDNRYTAFKFHVAKPKEQIVYSQRLFRVGTIDEFRRNTEYSVFYSPKVSPQIFYMSAGIGNTVYSYFEKAGDLHKSQISLTGKTNVGVRLIPKVLDFAFNFFGTLIAFTHNPNPPPEARFYGINGRLGYRLPVGLGATEFMFLTGWYFWGMMVNAPDTVTYGIQRLSGPQLFFTMINSQAGHNGWWMYFKVALISDKLKLTQFDSRELAIGGGYELSARETKPYSLTLDIAHAQFGNHRDNAMKLLSITAGIQKALW